MSSAAAAWDVLAKAANLAQVSGLHAAMLVAVLTALLRVQQRNKRECARLEQCIRRLHALLRWPTMGAALCSSEMLGGPGVVQALLDAAGLVESYKNTTLWRRVWCGGSMATQLREMHHVVDSYCGLLLFVNAHLLLQQQQQQEALHRHHPPIPPIPEVNDETSPSAQQEEEVTSGQQAVATTPDTPRASGMIGPGGGTDTDRAGCEIPDVSVLLPMVISHTQPTVHGGDWRCELEP